MTTAMNLTINKNLTVNLITFIDGIIQIDFDYFETIHGAFSNLTLNLDPRHFVRKTAKLSVLMFPDSKVKFKYSISGSLKLLSTILFIISISACGVFILGSYAHKMIGVETILVFQYVFIYFSYLDSYD
jgi:hypothetical protein